MCKFRCRAAGILIVMLMGLGAAPPVAAQMFSFGPSSGNSVYDRYVVAFSRKYAPGQIIVSFGDRRLYYISRRGRAISYPIAVPRAQDRWQGTLRVSMKRVNPPWTPTASMLAENPSLPKHVPGGHPRNPLGVRALYLGNTLYRIHGTDAPWTIGTNVSKGCVRMHNAHVDELYRKVSVGTKVTATWQRYRPSSYVSSNPISALAGFLGLN
jgi:lipoprotein-anchoring transpeptidase ErfK/SrfK